MKFTVRVGDHGCSAFTLVEVLVAGAILGTVTAAYYSALSSGFAVVASTREDLRATQIMTQKIEALRLCTWSQITNFNFQESYNPIGNPQSKGDTYFGTVSIGAASGITNNPSYYPNIRQVRVDVTWTNYTSGAPLTHKRSMLTQIARYGLQNYLWGSP